MQDFKADLDKLTSEPDTPAAFELARRYLRDYPGFFWSIGQTRSGNPLPAGATLFKRDGQRFAKWADSQPLPAVATIETRDDGKRWARWTDADGKHKRPLNHEAPIFERGGQVLVSLPEGFERIRKWAVLQVLDRAHVAAVGIVQGAADRAEIDPSGISHFARLCREWCLPRDGETWFLREAADPFTDGTWPAVLGSDRATLSLDDRAWLAKGEDALELLDVKRTTPKRSRGVPTPTYALAALRDKVGLGRTAFREYTVAAGVTPPERGKRNHEYTRDEARRILARIRDTSAEQRIRSACESALAEIPE